MTDTAQPLNVKQAVILLLNGLIEADTATPPDLVDQLPFARVIGRGGAHDTVTARRLFDIDVFADSEKACDDMADAVEQRILTGPHVINLGAGQVLVIDRADTVSAPQIVPWSSSRDVWRSVATYAFHTRSI